MNFEIDKREFHKRVKFNAKRCWKKNNPPHSFTYSIRMAKWFSYLTGTDLETAIREKLTANVHQKEKPLLQQKRYMKL